MKQGYSVLTTDWGYMIAVWSCRGLWELTFPRPDVATALKDITSPDTFPGDDTAMSAMLERELKMYFAGFRAIFTVPIDWTGYTPFQAAVLEFTFRIPYGEVTTYGQVAAGIGLPRACRAVGGALHINRTPVVVPCHRVVGQKGKLTGFGGGLKLKKALLLLEQDLRES